MVDFSNTEAVWLVVAGVYGIITIGFGITCLSIMAHQNITEGWFTEI